MEGLTGRADTNNDGLVSASELSAYTWDRTRLWAAQQGLNQTPWRMERVAGEIVLAKVGGNLPTSQAAATALAANASTTSSEVAAKSADGRFTRYGNGVIFDSQTDLEWYVGPDRRLDWQEAKAWVENLTVAGGGWYMPTRDELRALYQKGAGSRNIDPLFVTTGWYVWSRDRFLGFMRALKFKNGHTVDYKMWHPNPDLRAFAVRPRG